MRKLDPNVTIVRLIARSDGENTAAEGASRASIIIPSGLSRFRIGCVFKMYGMKRIKEGEKVRKSKREGEREGKRERERMCVLFVCMYV